MSRCWRLLCSGSWQVRRVCHGDAGLHGGQALPDPCRGLRCGERRLGWCRRSDAQQRERHGKAAWAVRKLGLALVGGPMLLTGSST